jgi:hypothetical protein
MAGISKDILVVQKENYRPKDATFEPNPLSETDRIRNYCGFYQTDTVRRDGTYLLAGYNEPMEASVSPPRGDNPNRQHLIAQGGASNLIIKVADRPPRDAGYLPLPLTQDIRITLTDTLAGHHEPNNPPFDTPTERRNFLANIVRQRLQQAGLAAMTNNSVFYDHTFLTPGAYSKTELRNWNGGAPAYFYDARPKYSYFAEGYESAVSAPGTEVYETLLPNIHAFIAEEMYGLPGPAGSFGVPKDFSGMFGVPNMPWSTGGQPEPVEPTIYERLITLDGRIEDVYTDILNPSPTMHTDLGDKIGEADRGEGYFKKYYLAIKGRLRGDRNPYRTGTAQLAEAYKKVLFSGNTVKNPVRRGGVVEGGRPGRILARSYERRNLFPLYNLMQFSTQRKLATVGFFTEQHVSELLLAQMYTKDTEVESQVIVSRRMFEGLGGFAGPLIRSRSENVVAHNIGINLVSFHNFITSGPDEFDGVYYGDKGMTTLDELSSVIHTYTALSRLYEVYYTKRRSYLDILAGKMAHSEVLAYKIEKYLMIDPGAPSLISTTIIPNQIDLDVINYVDSQIKYGEPYKYEVKQMVLVYGSKIEFKKGDPDDIDEQIKYTTDASADDAWWHNVSDINAVDRLAAAAKVEVTPDIKVYEVSYFNTEILKAVVTPPSPPHIGLVPYKSVDNKILINIDNSIDEYVDTPVILDQTDAQNASDVIQMQGDMYRGKIRFSGKTTGKEIENYIIYRTTRRPSSYDDFATEEIATVSTTVQGLKSSSAAYKDTIRPNTKYYYIVRTVDRHGFRSNPSTIYEVEIVSNSGTIYPIIRTIDLSNRPDGRAMSKPMRKHIQIKPNFLQTMAKMQAGQAATGDINLEDLIFADDILNLGAWGNDARSFDSLTIGAAQQSIWRKSFKVRFTSKQTGKKIDLNMTFRLRRDNS